MEANSLIGYEPKGTAYLRNTGTMKRLTDTSYHPVVLVGDVFRTGSGSEGAATTVSDWARVN